MLTENTIQYACIRYVRMYTEEPNDVAGTLMVQRGVSKTSTNNLNRQHDIHNTAQKQELLVPLLEHANCTGRANNYYIRIRIILLLF